MSNHSVGEELPLLGTRQSDSLDRILDAVGRPNDAADAAVLKRLSCWETAFAESVPILLPNRALAISLRPTSSRREWEPLDYDLKQASLCDAATQRTFHAVAAASNRRDVRPQVIEFHLRNLAHGW